MPIMYVDDVIVGDRLRDVNPERVAELAQSIKEIGLINPIVINNRKLIAGAHRLAAIKLLGWTDFVYKNMGDTNDDDSLELIEIDENLYRSELTPLQRIDHLARRKAIMVKRKMPEKLIEQMTNTSRGKELSEAAKEELMGKSEVLCTERTKLPKGQREVLAGAERAAAKEATDELQELFGKGDKTHMQRDIKTFETLKEFGIEDPELNKFSLAQLNRVAKVARDGGVEAARAEIDVQVKKPKTVSVVAHDPVEKMRQNISVLISARAIAKRLKPVDASEVDAMYYDDVTESIDALIDKLRNEAK